MSTGSLLEEVIQRYQGPLNLGGDSSAGRGCGIYVHETKRSRFVRMPSSPPYDDVGALSSLDVHVTPKFDETDQNPFPVRRA